ncbi:hypothetical protein LKO27_05530 [Tessaracoccus sp. OS52]|uniref:hypothetical protein n=1 Tax=Tessaracoccus sp. OS52 TaxID=2886691 RepID=UPI001D12C67F|nr:hypothetical protein [Tessaracoccus sp. OS52]MCC2592873.1 hypothetical protein [Tessaracoccus sp. OS52]
MPTFGDRERGAIAVWASLALPAFVACVGLGVDLAGHAGAQQDARAVAQEAARAAGQYLVVTPGISPYADTPRAVRAATAYVEASDFDGSAVVAGGEIRVGVTGSYRTLFLGMLGVDSLPVRGEAAAGVTTVIRGEER